MANSKLNGERYAYAKIDTAPGADGYWSDSVSMSSKNAKAIFFSYRGTGVATPTIQFRCPGDTGWTDLLTTEKLESGCRLMLDDFAAGVKYRAGVKEDSSADNTYTSGTVTIGFDW